MREILEIFEIFVVFHLPLLRFEQFMFILHAGHLNSLIPSQVPFAGLIFVDLQFEPTLR